MAGRPIPLNIIDEAFAKILIEELAQRDRDADLGDTLQDMTETASQRWETIAALEVTGDENGGQTSNGLGRPMIRPSAAPSPIESEPIPLEPASGPSQIRHDPSPASSPIQQEPSPQQGPTPGTARSQFWQFCITYPDGRQCTMPLVDKPITIGRDKDNVVVLMCEKVSRHHARILVDDRGPRVDDLNSVNGVLVNGIKVPAAYLKSGDVIRIGTVKIQLTLAE